VTADSLLAALDSRPDPSVATLPDGSVDRYCRLAAGGLDPVARRQTFAREVATGGRKGFGLQTDDGEPGGQCVNAATQTHALGADTTCYGHLDHSVLSALPFRTVSMGRPATVFVLDFDDGDLLLAEQSHDLSEWTLDDLEAVAPVETVFDVDAVCWTNWISVPNAEAAFHTLGRADLPRIPLVFDPGDVLGSSVDGHRRLREATTALQETFDVTVSVNTSELRAMFAALPDPPAAPVTDRDRVRTLREAMGVTAVSLHATAESVVVTESGLVTDDVVRYARPKRHTGGGDRFSGGLAFALGAGWGWETALQCANEAASYYVRTGETATVDDLVERLETVDVRE
jgi:sugar/nucleoside kinase (ribokinase family)